MPKLERFIAILALGEVNLVIGHWALGIGLTEATKNQDLELYLIEMITAFTPFLSVVSQQDLV